MEKIVTVYSTDKCPWCTKVKKYLDLKKVKYQEKNVSEDKEAAMEMIKKSGQQGVPVVDIDGQVIVGFDQPVIDKALSL